MALPLARQSSPNANQCQKRGWRIINLRFLLEGYLIRRERGVLLTRKLYLLALVRGNEQQREAFIMTLLAFLRASFTGPLQTREFSSSRMPSPFYTRRPECHFPSGAERRPPRQLPGVYFDAEFEQRLFSIHSPTTLNVTFTRGDHWSMPQFEGRYKDVEAERINQTLLPVFPSYSATVLRESLYQPVPN